MMHCVLDYKIVILSNYIMLSEKPVLLDAGNNLEQIELMPHFITFTR